MPDRGAQAIAGPSDVDPMGFFGLARHMVAKEDSAIFRRFDDVNILNLLCLQREVHELSVKLKAKCVALSDQPLWASYPVGEDPQSKSADEGVLKNERIELMAALRRSLKEYSKSILVASHSSRGVAKTNSELLQTDDALFAYNRLESLDTPNGVGVDGLRSFIRVNGTAYPLPKAEDDFVVLRSDTANNARVIDWARYMFGIIYYKVWGHRKVWFLWFLLLLRNLIDNRDTR